ncbi:hypothetical protein FHS89_000246 [Rubricella aquisinus]|uniref:Uncharacterized protein n=1 Tax=Rubricella aquisinus TaxID=2028108 RepID=A0A840WGH8_9RHOB|nr:hypothetical protein [Rubricella aquisinus]
MIRHRISVTKLIGDFLFSGCDCAEQKFRLACLASRPC